MENPFIFISYAANDRETARVVNQRLKDEGYQTWFDEDQLRPGQDLRMAIEKGLEQANIFLFLTSNASLKSSWVQSEIKTALDQTAGKLVFTVPLLLEAITVKDWPFQAATTPPVRFYEHDGWDQLLNNLRFFQARQAPTRPEPKAALHLVKVELANIRCFHRLKLNLKSREGLRDQVLILGDNGLGKTTLLRSVALGLCDEAGAAALMKESPGGFIRRGAKSGSIKLTLQDLKGQETYEIETVLTARSDGGSELVRQTVTPEDFPWTDVFVCGYGSQRARSAQAGYETYTQHHGVKTLFSDEATLQNPALILLRQPPALRHVMEEKLLAILMMEEEVQIHYPNSGVAFAHGEDSAPLATLSDGHKASCQWVLDLMAWLVYANRFEPAEAMAGVVLIDLPEQYLHPARQRGFLGRLKQQFPHIQFIAATHSPTLVSGLDGETGVMVKLEKDGDKVQGVLQTPPPPSHRADQVLTSPAFGMLTTRGPAYENLVQRIERLTEKDRSAAEKRELKALQTQLRDQMSMPETPLEQKIYAAVEQVLDHMLQDVDPSVLDQLLKETLHHLLTEPPP